MTLSSGFLLRSLLLFWFLVFCFLTCFFSLGSFHDLALALRCRRCPEISQGGPSARIGLFHSCSLDFLTAPLHSETQVSQPRGLSLFYLFILITFFPSTFLIYLSGALIISDVGLPILILWFSYLPYFKTNFDYLFYFTSVSTLPCRLLFRFSVLWSEC